MSIEIKKYKIGKTEVKECRDERGRKCKHNNKLYCYCSVSSGNPGLPCGFEAI